MAEQGTTVAARAAIAGNPSDGHGGAVVALPLPCFRAAAQAVRAERFTVAGSEPGDDLWTLVAAALRSARRLAGLPPDIERHVSLTVTTSIPRSVGLAGSSAIVIGVLRALTSLEPAASWARRLASPPALAVVALDAEVHELGIAAGLQDRLVQAHDTPLLMEFGPDQTVDVLGERCGTTEALPAPPGRFVLAHRTAGAESSAVVHGALAQRSDTAPIMAELADAARNAAAAIRAGSFPPLAAAMDRTFDLRASLLALDPRHVEMVDAARAAAGHANYTGSGGAAIVACEDSTSEERVIAALSELDDCLVTRTPTERFES